MLTFSITNKNSSNNICRICISLDANIHKFFNGRFYCVRGEWKDKLAGGPIATVREKALVLTQAQESKSLSVHKKTAAAVIDGDCSWFNNPQVFTFVSEIFRKFCRYFKYVILKRNKYFSLVCFPFFRSMHIPGHVICVLLYSFLPLGNIRIHLIVNFIFSIDTYQHYKVYNHISITDLTEWGQRWERTCRWSYCSRGS